MLIRPEDAREFFEGCVERIAWIHQAEAAEVLGVTRGRVSQLVKSGQLEAREDGMLSRADVERRLSEGRGAGRPRRG